MRPPGPRHFSRLDPDPVTHGVAQLLACAFAIALTYVLFPPADRNESFEEAAMRWGYRGPTRYVREIQVQLTEEGVGSRFANRLIGSVRRVPDRVTGEQGTPVPQGSRRGGGQGGLSDLAGLARESSIGTLRGRRLDLPLVQSEELVIVALVKPDYPQTAIEHGIEGRVELLALVNVRGEVEEVEIVHSGGPLLDQSARSAVRRCRFEPFRRNGHLQAVYADFKFNFVLMER